MNKKLLNILILFGIVYLGIAIFEKVITGAGYIINIMYNTFLVIIIAFYSAYLMYQFSKFFMENKVRKYANATILAFMTIIGILFAIFLLAIPEISRKIVDIQTINQNINYAINYIESLNIFNNINVGQVLTNSINNINSSFINFGLTALQGSILGITNVVIIIIITIYFLKDFPKIIHFIKNKIASQNLTTKFFLENVNDDMENYFKNIPKAIFFDFLIVTFFFYLITFDLTLALAIAIIVAALNFFPYIGGIVAFGLMLLTMDNYSSISLIINTLLIFIMAQIQGNFLYPRIYSKSIKVNPLLIILIILITIPIFGFAIALAFSIPTVIILKNILKTYEMHKKEQSELSNISEN